MYKYTSLELSKKLWENGCRLEADRYWYVLKKKTKLCSHGYHKPELLIIDIQGKKNFSYPAYDLLWDISVKYSKQFFSRGNANTDNLGIVRMLLHDACIEYIESFIWEVCNFNLKNKEK